MISRALPWLLCVTLAGSMSACTKEGESSQAPTSCPAPEEAHGQAVEKLVAAFNAHDIHSLLLQVHPEIEWIQVSGTGLSIETKGARDLGIAMGAYFAECPSCQSQLEAVCGMGPRVVTYEAATFKREGVPLSQRAIAVYEFEGGKVRRVYYFPADT